MPGPTTNRRNDGYEIASDLARTDPERIHNWLSTDAFWAIGRTRETVAYAARHSLNFGVFTRGGTQVAYALIVTDHTTFAWLCDVYVDAHEVYARVGFVPMPDRENLMILAPSDQEKPLC